MSLFRRFGKFFVQHADECLAHIVRGAVFNLRARHVEVTAAAEFLQQNLHIHVAEASCRNGNLIAHAENDERRAHALNGQQLVRRLRRRNAHIREFPVGARNGAALVDLRTRHKLRALFIGIERICKHLLHFHRVGAAAL